MASVGERRGKERRLLRLLADVADEIAQAAALGEIAFVVQQPVSAEFALGFERLFKTELDAETTVVLLRPEAAQAGPWDLTTQAWLDRPIELNQLKVAVLDGEEGGLLLLTLSLKGEDFVVAWENTLLH